MRHRLSALMLALVIGGTLVFAGLLYWAHQRAIDQRLARHQIESQAAFHAIVSSNRQFAEFAAEMVLRDESVLALMRASLDGRHESRGALYRRLKGNFELLYRNHVRQMQFVDRDGYSRLRVNAPDIAGDNLLDFRPLLQQALETKTAATGFEYGRLFSGYRYVYPVYFRDEFIGVLEIGLSFSAITNQMQEDNQAAVRPLLRRDALLAAMGEGPAQALLTAVYQPSLIAADYLAENVNNPLHAEDKHVLPDYAGAVERELGRSWRVRTALYRGDILSEHVCIGHLQCYMATFLPVKDPQDKALAYMLVYGPDTAYRGQVLAQWLLVPVFAALIALIAWLSSKFIASSERLRVVINGMGKGVLVQNREGLITFANREVATLLGYSLTELRWMNAHDSLHIGADGLCASHHACPIRAVMDTREVFESDEQVFRHKDGTPIPVRVTASPLIELGEAIGVVCLVSDLRPYLAEAQRLQQSRLAIQGAVECILLLDAHFRVLEANPAAEKVLGLRPDEVRGHDVDHLLGCGLPHGHAQSGELSLSRFLLAERSAEVELRCPGGKQVAAIASLSGLETAHAGYAGYVLIVRDVGELRSRDKLLAQQARLAAMGEMMQNVAHQWRQPLNALGLMIQNVCLDYEDGLLEATQMQRFKDESKQVVAAMSRTIDDFRDFFMPRTVRESFCVCDSARDAVNLVAATFAKHGIQIDQQGCCDPCPVEGFRNEYAQVVLNLLVNAKDAILSQGMAEGVITISTCLDDGMTVLCVTDNGGGIAPQVLDKAFDPYFTTKAKGTGIGLYMSRMIVAKMGGSLVLVNEPGGVRAEVRVPAKVAEIPA